MARFAPERQAHERKRFMRHDALRYLRPDAHRFVRPGHEHLLPPEYWERYGPARLHEPTRNFVRASIWRREDAPVETSAIADPRPFEAQVRELRCELAALRFRLAPKKLFDGCAKANFNPNQPRVPAGHPDGGQWTDDNRGSGNGGDVDESDGDNGGDRATPEIGRREIVQDSIGKESWVSYINEFAGDGSLSGQFVVNRDGSQIWSQFSSDASIGWDERHTVRLPDGSVIVFENSGASQTTFDGDGQQLSQVVWTDSGPEPRASFQLVRAPSPTRPGLLGAVLTLFTWWSSQNTADERAVFGFPADEFGRGADREAAAVWVARLSADEVRDACPRYPEVQSITNVAASSTDRGAYDTAAAYGTAIHKKIEEAINGPTTYPRSPPRNPDFRAKASVIKSEEAGYGLLGSKRIDVLENAGKGKVCVYDIKTASSGLSLARKLELASNVQFFYPGTRRIIVTEVRPSR